MKEIVKLVHGSHLYGLNTETSDLDFKGVFLPPARDCFLCKAQQTGREDTNTSALKNTSEGVDFETWSLQKFLHLCTTGQMPAIDMLLAPESKLLKTSEAWKFIQDNRSKLFSKKFDGFLGYIERQVSKYGVKGFRVEAVRQMKELLTVCNPEDRMDTIWDLIPQHEFIQFDNTYEIPMVVLCNRKIQSTVPIGKALETVSHLLDSYGNRALAAEKNEGVDWKAVSHAFRCALVVGKICNEPETFQYPLKGDDKKFILALKCGKLHFKNDKVAESLQTLTDSARSLITTSKLPEAVDTKFWEDFIVSLYEKELH